MMTKEHLPHLLVISLMALTSLALAYTVDVALMDEPGVLMVLPDQIGNWTGDPLKYCHNPDCEEQQFMASDLPRGAEVCPACGSELHNMSLEEFDVLPRDTAFVKSLYTHPDGYEFFVSIVLSGRERNSIHRPQRCLVGQGHSIDDERVRTVELSEGRPIGVTFMQTSREIATPAGPASYHSFYAYWFVGQGRETPRHLVRMFWLGWDRVVHSVAHKWAYVAVSGRRDEGSVEYVDEVNDFIALLHDQIVL